MGFDAQVSATFGAALATLRDTMSNQTGWTVVDDSSGGGNFALGDYVVLETAPPNEQIRLEYESSEGGIAIEHGLNWDSANTEWSDRWNYDPMQAQITGTNKTVIARQPDSSNPLQPTDSGSYWFTYWERGFGFYWQREVGDGDDGDLFIGMERVETAWDYAAAQTDESEWVLGFADSESAGQSDETLAYLSNSGSGANTGSPSHRPGTNTYVARGNVNPDNNFDNFPLTNTILSSSRFRNVEGEDAVIGTVNLWVDDRSGGDTGHRDLVQDSSGNNIYTILTRQTPAPSIALRMVDTLP